MIFVRLMLKVGRMKKDFGLYVQAVDTSQLTGQLLRNSPGPFEVRSFAAKVLVLPGERARALFQLLQFLVGWRLFRH